MTARGEGAVFLNGFGRLHEQWYREGCGCQATICGLYYLDLRLMSIPGAASVFVPYLPKSMFFDYFIYLTFSFFVKLFLVGSEVF
jgi:hypothetical protein